MSRAVVSDGVHGEQIAILLVPLLLAATGGVVSFEASSAVAWSKATLVAMRRTLGLDPGDGVGASSVWSSLSISAISNNLYAAASEYWVPVVGSAIVAGTVGVPAGVAAAVSAVGGMGGRAMLAYLEREVQLEATAAFDRIAAVAASGSILYQASSIAAVDEAACGGGLG